MKCEDLIHVISPLIDGELDEVVSEEWRGHIRSCRKCRAIWDEHTRIDALIKAIPAEVPAALNPLELVRPQRHSAWKFAMAGGTILLLICIFLIGPTKSLYERYLTAPDKEIRYNVSFNESTYQLSVTGKEVRLLSFEISENGSGSVNMSFEEEEKEDKDEHDKKNDSFFITHDIALCHSCVWGRKEA